MASIASTPTPIVDNTYDTPGRRTTLITGNHDYGSITRIVARISEEKQPIIWWFTFLPAVVLAFTFVCCTLYLFYKGVGIWGNMSPVFWAWPIVNFVFWVGIGHAGTLISAILFLFRQNWRTSINRAAEAMTIFAVVCAGIFPGIHVGRAWLAFWLTPYPSLNLWMWPQFRSPLLWDVFAVGTYASTSLVFWYMGMIPDLATFRDRSTNKWRRMVYGILCLGWSGSSRHWMRYEKAYTILAALAAPLVLSVHTVVSFDFAVSQLAWLAHHDLPALLRGRGYFLRFRDGGNAVGASSSHLRLERCDHVAPLGEHEQDHSGDRLDGWSGLRH